MNTAVLPQAADDATRARAVGTGLWLFIGVATTLFSLFLVAYAMRMRDAPDWSQIALPWQLGLSTALLLAGSVLMHSSGRAARSGQQVTARRLLIAGGVVAMAFLGAQLWGWQALIDARVVLAGNPAASFFYVLTALHGLHVLGGLVAWSAATPAQAWRIALCARYWHFLLAVWLVLVAALGWLTPEIVRFICGTS